MDNNELEFDDRGEVSSDKLMQDMRGNVKNMVMDKMIARGGQAPDGPSEQPSS